MATPSTDTSRNFADVTRVNSHVKKILDDLRGTSQGFENGILLEGKVVALLGRAQSLLRWQLGRLENAEATGFDGSVKREMEKACAEKLQELIEMLVQIQQFT